MNAYKLLTWFGYAGLNILVAYWNDRIRRHRIATKNTKQIEHWAWGIGYTAICLIIHFIWHDGRLFWSIILLHATLFSVAYNRFAGVPAFYLSMTTKAYYDRALRLIGFKSREIPDIIVFLMSIGLLILSIFNIS